MSVRGCEKCGYNLAGLPATGTVVTCPECAHSNGLEIPLPRRIGRFAPVYYGTIPAGLSVLCFVLVDNVRTGSTPHSMFFLAPAMVGGAIIAAPLTYSRFGSEPAMGRALRPLLMRLGLSALAGALSAILNAMILVAVAIAIKLFFMG